MAAGATTAFSGEVDAGSPQKMRYNQNEWSVFRFS
jgi:hypothetical protein